MNHPDLHVLPPSFPPRRSSDPFGVLDESRYGFRLSSGRRHIGHTDRTIHRIALRHFELRLHGASLTERGRQVRQPLHHLSKMPVCKAAMLAPCNPIQIEEEAWLWLTNELVEIGREHV